MKTPTRTSSQARPFNWQIILVQTTQLLESNKNSCLSFPGFDHNSESPTIPNIQHWQTRHLFPPFFHSRSECSPEGSLQTVADVLYEAHHTHILPVTSMLTQPIQPDNSVCLKRITQNKHTHNSIIKHVIIMTCLWKLWKVDISGDGTSCSLFSCHPVKMGWGDMEDKITVSFANVWMIKSFQQQAVSYPKIAQPIRNED